MSTIIPISMTIIVNAAIIFLRILGTIFSIASRGCTWLLVSINPEKEDME